MLRAWLIRIFACILIAAIAPSTARAQSADEIGALNRRVVLLYRQGKYEEATVLAERTLAISERTLGAEDPKTLDSVYNLAGLYGSQARFSEAELLFRRTLEGYKRTLGTEHPETLESVNSLALVINAQGRPEEAEPLYKLALAARERVLGIEHSSTLSTLDNLAALYKAQGSYAEAEPLFKRAMNVREQALGAEDPDTLNSVNNVASVYQDQGRDREAEPLFKRALESYERVLGIEHPTTLICVSNLASLYDDQGRYADAESLVKRSLASRDRLLGREHPNTITSVQHLASLYLSLGRYAEAEPLFKRALTVRERYLGQEDPLTLASLNGLADLYRTEGRYAEAEPLLRKALLALERGIRADHPWTLGSVNSLASFYADQGRYAEAEPLYKRALEARERVLGVEHPDTLSSVRNLAGIYFEERDWARAARFWRRSTAAIGVKTQRGAVNVGQALIGKKKSEAERENRQFWRLIKTVYRLAPEDRSLDKAASSEMFQTAQWALNSEAAQSLAQMAARGASGDPALGTLARERQDRLAEWQRRDSLRNASLALETAKRDAKAEAENIAQLATLDRHVTNVDKRLAAEFPDYAALVSPQPLSMEEAQAQLGVDEALVLFLDTPEAKPTPEETFIWVVTKTDARWVRSDLGTAALTRQVQALRCGLNEEEWATPTNAGRCANLLGLAAVPDASLPLPFHLGKAHALYQALFGQIEDMIAGKRLLIVPSGALTSLPFHVLVTKAPGTALPDNFEGYRNVAWLGRSNAITTLPAVSSLKALRQHASNRAAAADAYAGYGNPLLSGDGASCRVAKSPEACPEIDVAVQTTASKETGRATVRGRGGRRSGNATTDDVFAKGSTPEALLTQVRGLCPLPDTEYEIKCVAKRFGAKASLIRLAGEARETDIKALSERGKLAQYRVLHFATHGLLSGDVERMAQRQGEPALVLTPPDKPANADDDGLLMASEVAALKLNADWVVMSACNTAAGDKIGAQALSGLARAFFYAGGRALLVSHWPVYSDAAVRLTTSAFAELDRNPKAGRAEALQHAMNALIDDPAQADNAHPAVWAPFVVVGEGAR